MSKCTITMYGEQQNRYLWAVNNGFSEVQKNSIKSGNNPVWTTDTSFLTTYSNGLVAGNISYGSDAPTRVEFYREKIGDSSYVLVGYLENGSKSLVDYAVKNNETYKYYYSIVSGDFVSDLIESNLIKVKWENWCLMTVNDTDYENQYTLDKIFLFAINNEISEMRNNTSINKIRNFTPYLKIQRDQVNCWTGSLRSLIGYIDCSTGEYYDDVSMSDAIKMLSTDTHKKFLKNTAGDLWQIDISSDIGMQIDSFVGKDIHTQSMEYTEAGDATNVCIVKYGEI